MDEPTSSFHSYKLMSYILKTIQPIRLSTPFQFQSTKGVPYYGIYGVCIGILACRGLSLASSPLHAMKSQSQIQSSAAVNLGVHLVLNVWSPNTDLKKAEVKKAPVWIKLHHVPIVAYSEIGLSLIMTQLGKPIIMNGNPPRCATCKIFDHHSEICPKLVKDQPVVNDADEGFVEVKKKKHKNKNKQHKVAGVRLTKPQPQLLYRRVDRGETSQKVHTDKAPIVTQAPEFIVKNSFGPLDENEGDGFHDESLKHDDVLNVSDSEVDEEFQVDRNGNVSSNRTGASTPANESHVTNTNLTRLCSSVFNHWDWTSNGAWCNKGTRIIMGWNRNDVDGCHLSNEQVIHTPYLVEDGEKGSETSNFNYANLFNVRINDQDAQDMVREISDQEVKDAIFSIGDDKSPGPDGFTAAFFKEAWKYANDVLCVRSLLTIFADDLFLFALWDVGFTSIIKEALDEFKNASGLVPSLPKSTAYFCNVLNHVKLSILQILPFEEGKLPVKYLGVPLVSSRLMIRDCNELVDKVQLRKSKVAWEIVCLPKHEGGLGIRRLECFNSALMASHIWKLLTLKESLWVKWIHEYKLKGRNFWDFPMRGNMSWGWRKILKLRPIIRKFIWSKIGNGRNTSLWFDTWADFEPRAAQISPRDIVRSGLSLPIEGPRCYSPRIMGMASRTPC
ncbi:zinc knuckle CX2CX4HX4C containing protein [Tanacetum coccineum]